MKKVIFILAAALCCLNSSFARKSLVVSNPAAFDRKGEIVEVKVASLKMNLTTTSVVLKDRFGREVSYQLVFNGQKTPQLLIFQADVKAKSSSTYILQTGKPSVVKPKTSARFVPERKDDFAWENDICAFRMYGPALAAENPSNGVDVWLKRTADTIVDKRYRNELKHGITYHVDHGDGLDCYKVGHTLGAGGITPYAAGKLWVGDHYSSYKVLETGPLRSTFRLTYDSVLVNGSVLREILTITTTAGTLLNKATVRYEGIQQPIKLAAGIFLHDGKGVLKELPENGLLAYAENAVSDAGVPAGRNYVGVLIPSQTTEITKDAIHALMLANYTVGNTFTYYFGAGWSKWGFPADKDWFDALLSFSKTLKQPLKVIVK